MPKAPASQHSPQVPQEPQQQQEPHVASPRQPRHRGPSSSDGAQRLVIGAGAALSFLTVLLSYGPRIADLVQEILAAMTPPVDPGDYQNAPPAA